MLYPPRASARPRTCAAVGSGPFRCRRLGCQEVRVVLRRRAVLALRGRAVRAADFWGADCRGAALRAVALRAVALRGADLRGADLLGAALGGALTACVGVADARVGCPLERLPSWCTSSAVPPTASSTGHSTNPAAPSAPRVIAAAGVE
ncbi:MAG: pentapeptide repeat-containing protein, partial [Mycobacteriaceae bacterium]|nr:pentapeptide repeat-containing protein [Mycobacteriaceae bacterium]